MKSRIVPLNKVVCDVCSGEFDLKIREEEIEPEIIEQYFQCPYCGARTTITITDPDMREKIERRKQLRKDYKMIENVLRDKLEDAIDHKEYTLIWEIYGEIYMAHRLGAIRKYQYDKLWTRIYPYITGVRLVPDGERRIDDE